MGEVVRMDPMKNEVLAKGIRYLRVGSNIMLIVIFSLFFFFVVNPYLIEDVLMGAQGYFVSLGDIYFIEQVFGYYDYSLFLSLVSLAISAGFVMGVSLTMLLRRVSIRVKNLKSVEDSILRWEVETVGPLGLAVTIMAVCFLLGVFCLKSTMSADGLELGLNSGLVLGALTYVYHTMRVILKGGTSLRKGLS